MQQTKKSIAFVVYKSVISAKKKSQRRKENIPYVRGGTETFAGYPRIPS